MGSSKKPLVSHLPPPLLSLLQYLVQEHIWLFAIWLIPVSIVFDIFSYVRTRVNFYLGSRNDKHHASHEQRVRHVQAQIKTWIDMGRPKKMCTARPAYKSVTLQKITYKDRLHRIEVDLDHILSVDETRRLVRVEPSVTIGELNDFLIERGWTLPVVPELDDLTIGGLVMGGGIESTSSKYGLFQYICKSYQMIMPDASVLWCDEQNEPELYSLIPFSYGTLGFLAAVDIDIIPYKRFMRLTYVPVHSLDEVVGEFARVTNDRQVESVEGIMFNLDKAVIMNAVFTDGDENADKGCQINAIGKWYKPWFYKHVEKVLHNNETFTELIPTRDFYHRHNKSYFWLLKYIFPFANHPLFRYTLGWTMPTKFSLLKWLKQTLSTDVLKPETVIQDFGFDLPILKESLKVVDRETKIYPVWLCPARHPIPRGHEQFSIFKRDVIHVDVGVYGESPIENYDGVAAQRRLEQYALDTQSFVALYAETLITEAEYEQFFAKSMPTYWKLRKRFGCDQAFPTVYEKVSRMGRN